MTGADQPAADAPPRPADPRVELYGHAGCCLCDTARDVLERLRRELGFDLLERDITADETLHRAYFERVPVIVVDGEELCDYTVDEDALRRHLARAHPGRAPGGPGSGRALRTGAPASESAFVRGEDDLESSR